VVGVGGGGGAADAAAVPQTAGAAGEEIAENRGVERGFVAGGALNDQVVVGQIQNRAGGDVEGVGAEEFGAAGDEPRGGGAVDVQRVEALAGHEVDGRGVVDVNCRGA